MALRQRDIENQRLRDEVNNLTAALQERDGSVTHWKIKTEDTNRQIDDIEERHALLLKGGLDVEMYRCGFRTVIYLIID